MLSVPGRLEVRDEPGGAVAHTQVIGRNLNTNQVRPAVATESSPFAFARTRIQFALKFYVDAAATFALRVSSAM
jgi:hypothetical protein